MKIVSTRGVLAAAMLLSAAPAVATNGMRMIGFGPVQNSMGGASVGAPLDAFTIVTNPAGMSDLGRRADGSATLFLPTVKYTVDNSYGTASGEEQESNKAPSVIPNLGYVAPLSDKLTIGVGAFGISGMGVRYDWDLFGSETQTAYMNLRVAPAASYELSDQLSVGVAVNLMYAQMAWFVMGASGAPKREDGSAFGIGATLGLTYEPVKDLTLGLAYETKSFFGDFEFDIPAHTFNHPTYGAIPVAAGTEALDFDQPQVVTLGASYRVIEPLLVAADVEWIDWSSTNGKDQPEFTETVAVTNPWNMNWSDQVVVKLGAEFKATKELAIRAGYNYGKLPLDADRAFENIAFPAVSEHHVTLGAGYAVGALTVNVAAVISPEATIEGANPAQGIPGYETKMSQLAFDLGVGYKF